MSTLLARSGANMGDFERAIAIVRPIYNLINKGGEIELVKEIGNWLWSAISNDGYDMELDSNYEWALDLNFYLILRASTPDGMLAPLRTITRWLEILGQESRALLIRQLIRKEAPGTWYVDAHDRKNYIRKIVVSQNMEAFLKECDVRIQTKVITKLERVMEGERWSNPRHVARLKNENVSLLYDPKIGELPRIKS